MFFQQNTHWRTCTVHTRTRRREETSNPKFLSRRLEQPAIPPTYHKYSDCCHRM